jgi:hypothetical protein
MLHIDLSAGATENPVLWLYGDSAAAWIPVSPIGTAVGSMPSTLATNAVDVANSVWGGTGELIFEGATANAFENEIRTVDPTVGVATFLLPDQAAAADLYPIMFSVLATNALEVANSVWMDSNQIIFEGATADAFETLLVAQEDTNMIEWEGATADAFETRLIAEDADTGIHTFQLPDNAVAADTYNLMFSVLDTNALDVADSIWFEANDIWFEGAAADAFEIVITAADSTVGIDSYILMDHALAADNYNVIATADAEVTASQAIEHTCRIL